MKVIKKFWAPIFIVCFLLLGYVIGQFRNSFKADAVAEAEVSEIIDATTSDETNSEIQQKELDITDNNNRNEWNGLNLTFENSNSTTDNPWGFTAGIIDVDDEKCVFLTPNTDVMMYPQEEGNTISFSAYIHPWVSDSSDGAGLVIWYLDENDEILGQEELAIAADGGKTEIELDLNCYPGTNHLKILCNNGGKNNDSGDWVVLGME